MEKEMILTRKLPKEQLMEIIPKYFEQVAIYIRFGKRLPDELNPINFLTEKIDELSLVAQEELIVKIEEKTDFLKNRIDKLLISV